MKPNFTSRLMVFLIAIVVCPNFLSAQQVESISLSEDRVRHLLDDFEGSSKTVEICDLRVGETYRVWAVQTEQCLPQASIVGSNSSPASTFSFVADSGCLEMLYEKGEGMCEGPLYLSLKCTSVKIEKSEKWNNMMADMDALVVFPNPDAESLAKDIFIGGNCFDVTAVQAIGPGDGRGIFDSGFSTVGIKGGVILESGNVLNALGPNNSGSAGNNLGGGGDPDLQILSTATVFDAVGFEFDFTPTVDSLIFEFAFASEEYCEYVGSTFNDVFGFFISGPGIGGPFSGGGENIAKLPNGTVVAINNVNHQSNTGYFVGNSSTCGSIANPDEIQFDGYTVPIQAKVYLQACETYHIRLVVGDAGDGIFDSAVFLKGSSFVAGNAIEASAISASTGTNLIYEPCNDGMLNFLRVAGDITMPLVYDLFLDPSSTATPGLDYAPLPTQVVIPAGQSFVQIPIDVFVDGIPEGVETIILSMDNSCSCNNTEIIIEIADLDPIVPNLEPQELCIGEIATLDPAPIGGTGVYTYSWSDGSTDPILVVVPPSPPTYTVTVTDNCGNQGTATTTINVNQLPTASLTGDPLAMICEGDPSSTVTMQVQFTGGAPWTFVYSIDGINQDPITTFDNPYLITTNTTGSFQLVSVESIAGCEGTAFGVAVVNEVSVSAEIDAEPSTCVIGGIMVANINGSIPDTYEWSDPTLPNPSGPVQVDVPPGTYSVTITDINGCTAVDEATIEEIDPLVASTSFSNVDCSSGSGGTISISATSGSEPIEYNWSSGLPNQANQTGLSAGIYSVTIFDNIGCTIIDTFDIQNNSVPPAAAASTLGILNCTNTTTNVLGDGSDTGNNITYQWSGPGVVSGANEIDATVDQSGTYILTVTNNDTGCTSTAETEVDVNNTPPSAAASGNEISCTVNEVNLDGTGSSTGADFSYQWSGPGIVSGGTTLNPTVNAAGTYTLVVTNDINGCTEETAAIVTQDANLPTAIIADPITLDCNTNSLVLDGSGSSSGSGITYQWYENGTMMPGETSTSLSVSGPGDYQIVVSDSNNGCESNYAVEVEQDLNPPAVTADAAGQFTCTVSSVGLTANVPGNPSEYTYSWVTGDGSFIGGTTDQNATAGTPGNYEVVVTSALNGCTSTASVEVTQDASIPTVEIEPTDELDCVTTELQLDGSNSSQGATLIYTWTTGDGNITNGQNTLTPTIDAAGTYTLTINDSNNGCESENQIIIIDISEDPDLALASTPTLDCDVTSLVFGATVSNFPASDLEILWTTSDGMIDGADDILNAETSTPGTYTLTVTNINNGCEDVATVVVGQDILAPEINIEDPDELTCTSNTVTLDAGTSSVGTNFIYEWTTSTGSIVSGDNTLFPVVSQDGEYVLLITNADNGCTATENVTVDQNADVPQIEAGAPADFTCDITQMTLSGSGSTGAEFTYQWVGPGVLNGGTSLTPLVNEPGVYELIVTNTTNQCTASDLVTLGEDFAEPTAEAGMGGQLSCSVTTMTLDGTGSSTDDVTYLWTSPDGSIVNGQTTLSPEINAPGTYVIEVTNTLNGCTSTDEVLIEEDDDLPSVDIALAPPITCDVLEITLDGTGTQTGADFNYVWGASGGGNIVSGANTLEPTVNAAGTYALTVTNTATNCTNIGTVTVGEDTDPPAAEAGLPSELTCTQTTTFLNGGGSATGSNISYLWSTLDGNIVNGETTLVPSVDDPGTYTILVTDADNGCTNTDQVAITENNDVPTAVSTALGQLTCAVNEVQVSGSGSSQGPDFTYVWTTIDGNIVSGVDELVANVSEPATYFLTVTDLSNDCFSTTEVTVDVDMTLPTAEAGTSTDLTCDILTLDLDGTGSSSGSDYDYLWTTVDGSILAGSNTLNPSVGAVGTYLLTVTNNQNGCTSTDEVVVNQDQNTPTVSILPPVVLTCDMVEISLNGSISQGPDFEFTWSTANGNIVSGDETLEPIVDQPGTYVLFVSNSSNGCTNETSVNVSQNIEEPTAYAGLDFLMDCTGNNPTLNGLGSTGNGALGYEWATNGGLIESGANTAEPTIGQAGVYILTITDSSNGCTDTDEVNVSTTGPVAAPESFQPGCFGELGAIVVANVNGGVSPYVYSINGGNTFSTNAIYTDLEAGTYDIVVQDASGCEYVDEITLYQPPWFSIEVEEFAFINQGEEYQFDVQISVPLDEVAEIAWNPTYNLSCTDCLDPIASPEQSTVYHVSVVTKEGCEDDASLLLEVEEKADIYVPNAFNPLSDNEENNLFMIFTDKDKNLNVKSLQVFSRWGERVFEYYNFPANDRTYGWNGYHRESLLNPAVFVWIAEIEFEDGRVELFKGDVTLLH